MITLKTIEKEISEINKSLEDRHTAISKQKKYIKKLKFAKSWLVRSGKLRQTRVIRCLF